MTPDDWAVLVERAVLLGVCLLLVFAILAR